MGRVIPVSGRADSIPAALPELNLRFLAIYCHRALEDNLRQFNVKAAHWSAITVQDETRLTLTEEAADMLRPSLVAKILIADDQPDVIEALRILLEGNGYETESAASPAAVLEALRRTSFDLLLMDLNYARDTTSGREGIDLADTLCRAEDAPPVVVMTGWATVGLAVEVMQRGVRDFIEKPWDNAKLLKIVSAQISQGHAECEARRQATEEKIRQSELARERIRQEEELSEARRTQKALLPEIIPQVRGLEIAAAWQPAGSVGGDYFDVLKLDEDTLAICIADVAGKGMPAALLMSNLQATVRNLAPDVRIPAELCARANRLVHQIIMADKFITFFYAVLDASVRKVRYSNAGHNRPILIRQDGRTERLLKGGGVLGFDSEQEFESGEVEIRPGDRIALFTDGLTEAQNEIGEEFGETRLLELLAENRKGGSQSLKEIVWKEILQFSGNQFQDDATLILIAVN
ncbi:MAG: PP2C family protein-serine/threonine phosphatase [Candidatus Acidiferrales bacterium]